MGEHSDFSVVTPASEPEIHKILSNCQTTNLIQIPPTPGFSKNVECSSALVPIITNTVNISLISGQFHPTLKESVISPLFKKLFLGNVPPDTDYLYITVSIRYQPKSKLK